MDGRKGEMDKSSRGLKHIQHMVAVVMNYEHILFLPLIPGLA